MIRFLDLEASSLDPASFPIEVAWVGEDGCGEEYLIRPVEAWLADGCPGWSAESDRVHGISLSHLLARGVPAIDVAQRAFEALLAGGGAVYSDAPEMDGGWLAKLLAVAGLHPAVDVRDVREAYGAACRPLLASPGHLGEFAREQIEEHARSRARAIIVQAEEAEARRPRIRHRAWPDAESLWRTWSAIGTEVARSVEGGVSPFPPPRLLKATFRGERRVIACAKSVELEPLFGTLAHEPAEDTLEAWSLVALRREDGTLVEIRALGWRSLGRSACITSPVTVLDPTAGMIRTRSDQVYGFLAAAESEVGPGPLFHLAQALRSWGYVDVQP